MKKMLKIIFSIIVLILSIGIIVLVLLNRNNKFDFLSFCKHYSILVEDYPKIEISVFSKNKDNDYLTVDKIDKCTITNQTDYYIVDLNGITKDENTKQIRGHEYYQYKMELKFDLEINNRLNIDNAMLEIIYKSGEKLHINIGNICFEKVKKESFLSIDKVQSICNDIGNLESIVAVKVSVENKCGNEILIKNIIPISNTISINNNSIKILEYDTYIEHNISLSNLFNTSYDLYQQSTKLFESIELKENIRKDIVIPLTYTEKQFVDHIGFVLELEIENETYFQIINPYVLFSTSKLDYVTYEHELVKN